MNGEVKNPGAPSDIVCEAKLCDFLSIDPNTDKSFSEVTAILVDPSCTGSGLRWKSPELVIEMIDHQDAGQKERVVRLANLQAKILRHALSFPSVQVVVYSTCSIYQQVKSKSSYLVSFGRRHHLAGLEINLTICLFPLLPGERGSHSGRDLFGSGERF